MIVGAPDSADLIAINGATNSITSATPLPGPFNPFGIAFDSSNGNLYITGQGSGNLGNVTVFNPSSDKIVTNITVGAYVYGITYGPSNNALYVSVSGNSVNVTVINGTTNTVVNEVTVIPNQAEGLAYDSANRNIYGVDASSELFSLNVSTNITSLVTQVYHNSSTNLAQSLLYVPSTELVFVDSGGAFFVVNVTINPVVSSVSTGSSPQGSAYDPVNGMVYVANAAGDNLYIINPSTETITGNITIGMDPYSPVYDPVNGLICAVYVSSISIPGMYLAFAIAAINPATGKIVASVSMPVLMGSGQIAVDSSNGNLFVTYGSGLVYIINGTTNRLESPINVGVGANAEGLAYVPATDSLYVVNSGSGNVSVINATTEIVVSTIVAFSAQSVQALSYDSQNGYLYITVLTGTVEVINTSSVSLLGSIAVGSGPFAVLYDPSNFLLYVTNQYSGSVSMIESPLLFNVTMTESGLPSGTTWYVNLTNSQTFSSATATITFGEPNGTYTYSIATSDKSYTAPGGSFAVSGSATAVSVTFNPVVYTVTFTESGLTSGTTWYVTLNGVTVTSTTGTVTFNETNGTYSFTAGSYTGYYVSPSSGSITVNGAPASQAIAFNESMFLVTFTETGLPSGTTWYVNLSGEPSLSSSSAEITATLPNGTYIYSVGTTDKLFESGGGTFIVNGAQLNRTVTFTKVTYSVTFTESGLPSGETWFVNLTGGQSFSSTATSISFNEPNGSYSYVIGTSFREYSAKGGSFSVAGSTESLSVTFSIVDYNLTFTESGLPSGTAWSVVVNGANVTLARQDITFSLPNGTYQFTVVPPSGYTTQTVTGTVTVHGSSVSKAISFTSASSSPPPGNSPFGIFGGTLITIVILAGVVVVIAAVAVVFVRMRRKF